MSIPDHQLVEEALNGNYEAYAELVHRYSNLVYAVAVSKTKDFYQSQDIAQDVFVKAWQKLSYLKNSEKFSNWIITITRNHSMDWLRKKVHLQEEMITTEYAMHDPSLQNVELKDIINTALESLDEKYRVVTIMHYISGYTAKDISLLLDISLSAIESRLRRARDKLKKELLISMVETYGENKFGKEFEEDVMWRIVPRISTIEIPVLNIEESVAWYSKMVGTKAAHQDSYAAMLHLQGANRIGVPTLYLVQTDEMRPLGFKNSHTGVIHSVIDFFIEDLERFHSFLKKEGVKVTDLNFFPGSKKGGFGFEDPSGNLLSACNVTHSGQE